jgi:S-DNA-T family DNA segregation ATPase FtsK/SpoIIIE
MRPPLDLIAESDPEGDALRALIDAPGFVGSTEKLKVVLGRSQDGTPCIVDLATLPHLLIGDAEGSRSKAGLLNALLATLLIRTTPADLRLVLIDRSGVAFRRLTGVPHLWAPPITGPIWGVEALRWAVHEMERRYRVIGQAGARNIDKYNAALPTDREQVAPGDVGRQHTAATMPRLLFVINELADVIGGSREHVEESIVRLGQMSRAAGIHLIVGTTDTSPCVLTGRIKVSLPARLCCPVTTASASRAVLDAIGADWLATGECLYLAPTAREPELLRVAAISEEALGRVADFWRRSWQL